MAQVLIFESRIFKIKKLIYFAISGVNSNLNSKKKNKKQKHFI